MNALMIAALDKAGHIFKIKKYVEVADGSIPGWRSKAELVY